MFQLVLLVLVIGFAGGPQHLFQPTAPRHCLGLRFPRLYRRVPSSCTWCCTRPRPASARRCWWPAEHVAVPVFIGIFFATILGFVVGVARLSRNWLISRIASITSGDLVHSAAAANHFCIKAPGKSDARPTPEHHIAGLSSSTTAAVTCRRRCRRQGFWLCQ